MIGYLCKLNYDRLTIIVHLQVSAILFMIYFFKFTVYIYSMVDIIIKYERGLKYKYSQKKVECTSNLKTLN